MTQTSTAKTTKTTKLTAAMVNALNAIALGDRATLWGTSRVTLNALAARGLITAEGTRADRKLTQAGADALMTAPRA